MGALQKVVEVVEKPGVLVERLGEREVQEGLRQLEGILAAAVGSESGGFQSWSKQQLDFILAIVGAVLSVTCNLVADGGDKEVVEQIYGLVVQLCLQALENSISKFAGDAAILDEEVQQKLLLLLEIAVIEGKGKERGTPTFSSFGDSVSQVPSFSLPSGSHGGCFDTTGNRMTGEEGTVDSKEPGLSDNILLLLASEQHLIHQFNSREVEAAHIDVLLRPGISIVAAARHFSVVYVKCVSRLLALCRIILESCQKANPGDEDKVLQTQVFLVSSILKLLVEIARACVSYQFGEEVVKDLVGLVGALPVFFQLSHEHNITEPDFIMESNLCCLLPSLVDELLQLAEIVFPDQNLFLGTRTYLAASFLDILVVGKWKPEGLLAGHHLSLACTPHVISRLLGLIQDIHTHSYAMSQIQSRSQECGADGASHVNNKMSDSILVCQLRGQKFILDEVRNKDEHLQTVFSGEGHWLDNLVAATRYLHSHGHKEGSVGESALLAHSEEESGGGSMDAITVASEDDALFGDLFSESGRHSVNSEGNTQTCSSSRKLDSLYNTPLRVTNQIISFMKDTIFSADWHRPTFETACKKLCPEHLDVFLQIHLSQSSIATRHAASSERVDSEVSSDLLAQLCKVSFDLLHMLVVRRVLSPTLELHLAGQILKEADSGCALAPDLLILIARLLINRASRHGHEDSDDQMVFMIWKHFVDSLLNKAQNVKLADMKLEKICAILPSALHLEFLFMAFHSASMSGRVDVLQNILSALKTLCHTGKQLSAGTSIAVWSLIVSRLVLTAQYLVLHFNTFPKWLLVHLQKILRTQPVEGESIMGVGECTLPSWAAIVARTMVVQSSGEQETLDQLCIEQLFDVSRFSAAGWVESEGLSCSHWDLCELGSVLDDLLEVWRGRTIKIVEELFIERHVFLLSLSILRSIGPARKPILPWNMKLQINSSLGSRFFFGLGRILRALIHQKFSIDSREWKLYVGRTFSDVVTTCLAGTVDFASWDFLRQGGSLSLLLSLLQAGLWTLGQKQESSVVESSDGISAGMGLKDAKLLEFLWQSVSGFSEDDVSFQVLKSLSSLMTWYVGALRVCVSHVLKGGSSCSILASSVDIVLHGGLGRNKQHDVLEVAGINPRSAQALLRWGLDTTWEDEYIAVLVGPQHDKRNFRDLNNLFLPALLHGFPSRTHSGSAAVVSCMLCLESILETVGALLKNKDCRTSAFVGMPEESVYEDLLGSVLAMMLDSTFENIWSKCTSLFNCLVPSKKEQAIVTDMHLLRQGEALLRLVSAQTDVNAAVRERVIMQVVDAIKGIQVDQPKCKVLKCYYFGDAGDANLQTDGGLSSSGTGSSGIKSLAGSGSLSPFIDVLDGCSNETVNLKVLQLLLDLLGGEGELNRLFKSSIQRKFLEMDMSSLSRWLEIRLLGCYNEDADGSKLQLVVSHSVRELATSFLQVLVTHPPDPAEQQLRSHLVSAILVNLGKAFMTSELVLAKAYFSLLVQLASGEALLKRVLSGVVDLLGKLTGSGPQLENLKLILTYLDSILVACGAQKSQTYGKLPASRHWTSKVNTRAGVVGIKVKPTVVKRSPEQLMHTASDPRAPADCDAISGDEDEDDATSDGELASLDRDDDDDSSERALASKVCTFTSSGSNFMEQHWYFCYTCDLTVSKGCCSVCARVCHRGHKVVYSRLSRFFCDCGAGGVRGSSCLCLKPRKYVSLTTGAPVATTNSMETFLPITSHLPQSESDTDGEEEGHLEGEMPFKISISDNEEKELLSFLTELDIEGKVLSLCDRLSGHLHLGAKMVLRKDEELQMGEDKNLSLKSDLLQLKRAYKSGSLDMKIKAEYSSTRDLKSHLASGSLVKSLLSISSRGRLAAGEGDKVTIFDVGQLIGLPTSTPVTVDKTTVKPLSKNAVRFELVHVAFNTANESYLAVAGYEDCHVFTVNPRGEVTDRLAVELALLDAYIRKVSWVPGSQVQLLVVTNKFLKIYDLSQDKISPTHYFTVLEDAIADACLVCIDQGQLVALVLSQQGVLYSQLVTAGGDSGAHILTENIQLPERFRPVKGTSLSYSAAFKLLFVCYADGLTLIGRLNQDATRFLEVSCVLELDQDGKSRSAGLHHWREIFDGTGLFTCLSSQRSHSAVAVRVGTTEMNLQHLRVSANALPLRVDGIAAYRPMTKERNSVLVLHDDGSLQVFSFIHSDVENRTGLSGFEVHKQSTNLEAEQGKKLGAVLLGSRTSFGAAPVFPLDFFEKTNCITTEVKFGGDVLRNSDSEGVKLSLAADDGFVESPSASGFKILILNSNPELVMVGCRVHVGNTSASHIPSEVRLFQRTIRLEEGVRSWYDVPFTSSEALLADEEFALTIGPTYNSSSLPRIDCLEIYARSKDEFGWKDAVLELESQGQGASTAVSGSSGRGVKNKMFESASVWEQLFSDSLHLLHSFYLAYRSQATPELEEAKLELCRRKCMPVLQTIFEVDRQPLLQSTARHVLRALFPLKETYYQAKDSMRLAGVAHSCPVLASRVSARGPDLLRVIQEYVSQMHALCKIAMHRHANLATFLEQNGASVVDDLVKVLWEILAWEQLDAQTINNLVIPMVDLIYGYAECLVVHTRPGVASATSVAAAVALLRKLLFSPNEAVQTSCSLAISSTFLQVPLPKQTMLAMDDVAETSRATSIPSESGSGSGSGIGGPGQVMMDEDGNTASVQYCCDGCSIVPILRQRWHCNICPDFDLCEACYEVMDADQLPPPHTRDHSMSAILIEADSTGGDGSDMQFSSIDELSDESLLQMATELSLQSSNSPISFKSGSDNQDGLLTNVVDDMKGVAISASRSAVNCLLLQGLVEEIQGWMRSSSGAQALPVMQLFYRLASAPSGPLVESPVSSGGLDLERLIKLMMQEMDLNVPPTVKVRTNLGEVTILAFMFFTLVLRNWHQPGTEQQARAGIIASDAHGSLHTADSVVPAQDGQSSKDGGTQLDRACAALRQQALVTYLFNTVQQLTHVFKSSSRSSDTAPSNVASAGCGSLLIARREFASGSFIPFFSDAYAKARRGDLFGDFHRLLLESAFRLTYSLIRPEKSEKTSDRDHLSLRGITGLDLKLDGWQEVLCSFINNSHTVFIRKYARRLLLHLCGTKGYYYSVRDSWQLSKEVKRLYKLAQKSGGFQVPVHYERSVKLMKCLSSIAEVAAARPRNWQKYCTRHADVLQFLLRGVFSFREESVVQTLKLLMLVFYTGKDGGSSVLKTTNLSDTTEPANGSLPSRLGINSVEVKKKSRSGSEDTPVSVSNSNEKIYLDMELATEQLAADNGKILRNFIDTFLLEWNATSVRLEAKAVLHYAWNHGKHIFRAHLLTALLEKVPVLPSYGQNMVEYTDLLTWLLRKGSPDVGSNNSSEVPVVQACLTADVVKKIFDVLCAQNELLANHPNSRIYNTLASLVEFDGYYLESEPCLVCSSPEVPYTKMKLDNLKSETKFTDNRILVKCIGSHTIQSVTMNVHDPRRSKSVKVLNLYYNNRTVADLSELKNNWSLWKRARSCHLTFNQVELKVEFPIPITACNFMIELDSFFENLQASSLESLQCPRCSRYVTDKHGICGNCRENAYQCRQCRNINYENLDSFLCNECGYSKYGRFEFNFMAKPSFIFDSMENDEDMKKGLLAIEAESENAHRRYQQLLGFKKPLLKLVSSISETEMDSQQKDSVQQMIVSLPGSSSFKINRKIAILGVLYGEKCRMAFDSVSKSVQTLQGLRRVLMAYLERKRASGQFITSVPVVAPRPTNRCFGCANAFVAQCLEWLQVLAKQPQCRQQLVSAGILRELFENNVHQGPKAARIQARAVLCAFTEGDGSAVTELNALVKQKTIYCLEHHRSMDVAACVRDELQLLSETCSLADEFWEERVRVASQLLLRSIQVGAKHPVIAEHIILPCLRIVSQAYTPPKSEVSSDSANFPTAPRSDLQQRLDPHPRSEPQQQPEQRSSDSIKGTPVQGSLISNIGKSLTFLFEKETEQDVKVPNTNYIEWKNGATYVDFVRRQYMVTPITKAIVPKVKKDPKQADLLARKYLLKWKGLAYKGSVTDELTAFEESTWVHELVLSPCSQAIRLEMCGLIDVLCTQSPMRRAKFLNILMTLLPSTQGAGESAAEYFDILFKMIDSEDSRLFLTVRGFLQRACSLITAEVGRIEAQEWSLQTDISQGYILHKLIELLNKFLLVPNIRARFLKEDLLAQILEALLAMRGLVVQKTKLTGDCSRLLRELLDGLLQESYENKRHFIRACISGLQSHSRERRDRTSLFILEQLCDIICPRKPEQAYMMVLHKAHTQEEFIRGSMTKNPYSSLEIGPLMRDVKNKICHHLELLGLLEDDYGMELLVAGNIISLDISVAQVYEQVWKKAHGHAASTAVGATLLSVSGVAAGRDCPPMTITYRLQGLDGEATEPMIKELEEDREESQDPEVEFAISGVMQECGGLEIILSMVQRLSTHELKAGQEELALVLKLLMYCCKIRANRQALLQLGALGVLLEAARRAFSTDAAEPAEGLLLIVESLVSEANESDPGVSDSLWGSLKTADGTGVQAASAVGMFLERLSHPTVVNKSNKQQQNNETVARILPYLTYGEQAAMEALVEHFIPYLQDWAVFDKLLKQHHDNPKNDGLSHQAAEHQLKLGNFVKVTESIKQNPSGERLKSLIMEKGITAGAIWYLKGSFPVLEKGVDYRSTPEWVQGLEMPSVPIILSMLRGLSRSHLATQKCIDEEGILPLLHALEGVSGENDIGAKAENLLDTLADKESKGEGFLVDKVLKLRHATRDEMRRRALRRREELLLGLGMVRELRSDGGERIVVAKPHIEGLEEVEEEEAGLACMVCREGYKLRPTDMLGTYCYSKRMKLSLGSSNHVRAEWVYTTVSHFNVIHFQCHQEAKRADASLKNPKKEWEGATLRNSETLCNNLFPLRGPVVPLAQYTRCVDQYWDSLNALGRADGSRLRLLTYDLVMLLARFATGASFSVDSKGGGRESNSRLLPFMVQMARHLLDQGGASQRRIQARSLALYLSPPAATEVPDMGSKPSTPTTQRTGSADESVQFMMVQSLLLQSLEDWQHYRRTFLQRAIVHAYGQFKQGRSLLPASPSPSPLPSPRNTSEFSLNGSPASESKRSKDVLEDINSTLSNMEQLFTLVQPMLVYVGLVDQMQQFLKGGIVKVRDIEKEDRKSSNIEASKDEGSVHCGIEPWETCMKDRLRDVSAMLGFAKDLLEWLEEMHSAQDIQEALDVMGALRDALSSGYTSCEDFVRDTIASSQFR